MSIPVDLRCRGVFQCAANYLLPSMKKTSLSILAMALAVVLAVGDANAKKKNETLVDSAVRAYQSNHSFTMPAAGTIEVAFSPDKGSEALVIKVIDATRTELRVLSCRF